MIYLITGPRMSGKTTLVQQLVQCAHGWRVTGILTIGEWHNGEKLALYARDLRTGEQRLLARRQRATEPWEFVAETLEWGNRVFTSAVPTDLLVVDELGPLEWVEARGWTAGLSAIDSGQYRVALVVVRPELLTQAQHRWPHATLLDVSLRQPTAGEGE